MRINDRISAKRQWLRLGNTLLDLSQVVKIEFQSPDARLFVISGEALLMTAWTESRSEILNLKQLASESAGWILAAADVQDPDDDADFSEPESGSTPYPVAEHPDDAPAPRPRVSDHRINLSAVDKAVTVSTALGATVELFASGVFVGQVSDPGAIGVAESFLQP